MSQKFLQDVEQALGPVLLEHFYSKKGPKNLLMYAQHAAKLAAVRFIRSQTGDSKEAAKMLGTSVQAISSCANIMGYSKFNDIPKDEWQSKTIFYKKS